MNVMIRIWMLTALSLRCGLAQFGFSVGLFDDGTPVTLSQAFQERETCTHENGNKCSFILATKTTTDADGKQTKSYDITCAGVGKCYRGHLGEDWRVACGTDVYPIGPGKVIIRNTYAGWGKVIIVQHDLAEGSYYSVYGHLKQFLVTKDEQLNDARTKPIAKSGAPPNGAGSGCHLHLGVKDKVEVNREAGAGYTGELAELQDVVTFPTTPVEKQVRYFRPSAFISGHKGVLGSPFDAVTNFVITDNPRGPWSYGYIRTLGGPFTVHVIRQQFLGIDRWATPSIDVSLGVAKNTTGMTLQGSPPTFIYPADMLHLHPAADGTYDVVRWTAPRNGTFGFFGRFVGLDAVTSVADSDVHILRNGIADLLPPFTVLRGIGTEHIFSFSRTVVFGETFDFAVGKGPSGFHQNDSTGLKVTIVTQ